MTINPVSTTQDTSEPAVACTDLLAELRAAKLKLNCLLERSRGPGKHLVYMNIKDAYEDIAEAVYAEEERIAANDQAHTPPP